MLEHYPKKSDHKLANEYKYVFNKFKKSPLFDKYLLNTSSREIRIGLDDELRPCDYKNAMFRGIIDFVTIKNDVLFLVDWKTGKYKEQHYQDYNQLLFYSIYFFEKCKNVDNINISYVYVEHDIENELVLERRFLENYKKELINIIRSLENDTNFVKNESKLCDWCPFKQHCLSDV